MPDIGIDKDNKITYLIRSLMTLHPSSNRQDDNEYLFEDQNISSIK